MRIRSLKPEFWRSEDVADLDYFERLLFVGLWSYVDDNAVGLDRLAMVCADLFAIDLERDPEGTYARVRRGLDELSRRGLITRYEGSDGRAYLLVVNFSRHQKIDRPSRPRYPLPTSGDDPQGPDSRGLGESSASPRLLDQGAGDQGAGDQGGAARPSNATRSPLPALTSEPPLKCPKHLDDPNPPACGGCGDARRGHQAWERAVRSRPTPVPARPECPLHPGNPTGSKACPVCESEAWHPDDAVAPVVQIRTAGANG